MAETSKSSHSSPSGTTPAGNGVSGGGEPGFHSQQMQQQFAYSSKFQSPLGLHQQRPVMVPYEQHSVSHQQGPYAHHAPYHQLLQQQQVQYHQQPHQQPHQQTHQQTHQQQHHHQSIQFMQQAENVQQQSMQYVQDEQKSSDSQFKQKLESSDSEAQVKEDSSRVTTATEKPAIRTGSASAKDSNLTPEQRDIVAKELEAVRAAHEKQVKELEERIKSLEEQKSQKEVKYLRVTNVQKKKKLKKSLESENIKGKSALDDNQEKEIDNCEDIDEVYSTRSRSGTIQKKKIGNSTLDSIQKEEMDTCEDPEECDVFDSCPSPANSVYSDVSIKEEQDDDIPAAKTYYEKKKAIKATIEKEESKSDPENIPPKSYTLSVTDFDFCIYCQTKSEKKMLDVTEDIFATIQSIVLNVDCEESQRLKDYVLDIDMFFYNLPQYHSYCQNKLRDRLLSYRKKKKISEETDISLCIICQENKIEALQNCTNTWFASLQSDLSKMDDDRIENVKKSLNFDRFKNLVGEESAKDQQISTVKFKFHKNCRFKFIVKKRPKKKLKNITSNADILGDNVVISEPKNMENNVEITADEEIFELLAERKKKIEKKKRKKQRNELPEPNEFDYKRCIICGKGRGGGDCRSMTNASIQKTRDNANKNQHSDIIKILEHGVNFDIELFYHGTCNKSYNYNRPIRVNKGTVEYMERAFEAIITEIEEPMFRNGKVFCLDELREKYLKSLMEFKLNRDCKMGKFVNKIKKYYTFKKCRVNVIPYPDYFIYSNHLSESQVAPQIDKLKKDKKDESNEDSLVFGQNAGDMYSENSKIKEKYRFLCTECGYKCQKKSSLKNHLKTHDLRSVEEIILSEQIMCDICGKMLKNKKSLQTHLLTHSDNKVKYSCSQCDKTYFSKYALNTHELSHTGEKNVECPYCDKKFLVKKYIHRHIRLVHETKTEAQLFLCSVCGQNFKTKQALNEHSRKHSDARPFVCKECGKTFKFRSPWRIHMLAHEGKKPQMCSICSFGCYTKANLKIHMAIHTENNVQEMCFDAEEVNEKSVLEKYINLDEVTNIKSQAYFPL